MVIYAERNVNDVEVNRFVTSVPANDKAGPRKNKEEARVAVNVVYNYSLGLPGPLHYISVIEDEMAKQGAPWDLPDLTSKNDRGPSALQRIQASCQDHGLSVSSHILAVRVLIMDALAAFDSSRDGIESLGEHR